MNNLCPFCNSSLVNIYDIKQKKYVFCTNCGGIALEKSFFSSDIEQKNRYILHENTLNNIGYKKFLCNFANPILDFLQDYINDKNNLTIFDFGSGPVPCLCELLKNYVELGKLPNNTEFFNYDKFFTPEKNLKACDLCFCLEVVEHFEKPLENFIELANCVKKDGFLAVGTILVPKESYSIEEFSKWWYKDDFTHVSFYTEKALELLGNKVGLKVVKKLSERCILFQKI